MNDCQRATVVVGDTAAVVFVRRGAVVAVVGVGVDGALVVVGAPATADVVAGALVPRGAVVVARGAVVGEAVGDVDPRLLVVVGVD